MNQTAGQNSQREQWKEPQRELAATVVNVGLLREK